MTRQVVIRAGETAERAGCQAERAIEPEPRRLGTVEAARRTARLPRRAPPPRKATSVEIGQLVAIETIGVRLRAIGGALLAERVRRFAGC